MCSCGTCGYSSDTDPMDIKLGPIKDLLLSKSVHIFVHYKVRNMLTTSFSRRYKFL